MAKPINTHLRALRSPRNGRSPRRAGMTRALIHLSNGRPSMRIFRGWGLFRGVGRALGEIFGMAIILALSIVLAHAMLVVMFPV